MSVGSLRPISVRNSAKKLLHGDIVYLEGLKTERLGITSNEMKSRLAIVSLTNVSERTVRRAVQHHFTCGVRTYTRSGAVAQLTCIWLNMRCNSLIWRVLHNLINYVQVNCFWLWKRTLPLTEKNHDIEWFQLYCTWGGPSNTRCSLFVQTLFLGCVEYAVSTLEWPRLYC